MQGCFGAVRTALIVLIGGAVAIAVGLSFWFAGSPPEARPAAVQDAEVVADSSVPADPRMRISSDVFTPYDKAQYPRLSGKVGERWEELQPLRERAAMQALKRSDCREVTTSEISVDRSTRGMIRVFVYCDDSLSRIDFDETELRQ